MSNTVRDNLIAISQAWSVDEQLKVTKRFARPDKMTAFFKAGYRQLNPPHVGRFGCIAYVTLVSGAFMEIIGSGSKLMAFNDHINRLLKVPENTLNEDSLTLYFSESLTLIFNVFRTYEDLNGHGNVRLCLLMHSFGLEYEIASSSFDIVFSHLLECHDGIITATLSIPRMGRQVNFPRFLPVHPFTYIVIQVPMDGMDRILGLATWEYLSENSAKTAQQVVYKVGRRHPFLDSQTRIAPPCQTLLGQQEDPSFGGFVTLCSSFKIIVLIHLTSARQMGAI
jgi:lysyl-tRNA synthetase class 1